MSTTVTLASTTPDSSIAAGTIRVVIADAQRLVRAGVGLLVEREPGITVVGEAATGEEAIRLAQDTRADVVLIDAAVRDGDCVDATRRIVAGAAAVVVVIAETEHDSRVFAALRAGAARRLRKDGPPDQLVRAIRQCAVRNRRPRRAAHHFATPRVVELVPRDRRRRGER